jgi:predicted RNA-binding protein Jag
LPCQGKGRGFESRFPLHLLWQKINCIPKRTISYTRRQFSTGQYMEALFYMKSIVQEASSVAKAVEKAVEKLGNPRDFSIKILEYPEKNFFGLTTKPAKVAVYCDEKVRKAHEPHPLVLTEKKEESVRPKNRERTEGRDYENSRQQSRDKQGYAGKRREPYNKPSMQKPQVAPEAAEDVDVSSSYEKTETKVAPQRAERTPGVVKRREPALSRWNPEIVEYAREWITHVLGDLDHAIPFTIDQDGFHIRITLERPLFGDPEHERRVLASLSLLLLETCKHVFKINLRDHRVVLVHKAQ